jgi:hypothetical protein
VLEQVRHRLGVVEVVDRPHVDRLLVLKEGSQRQPTDAAEPVDRDPRGSGHGRTVVAASG